jgi:hypothetical protein
MAHHIMRNTARINNVAVYLKYIIQLILAFCALLQALFYISPCKLLEIQSM